MTDAVSRAAARLMMMLGLGRSTTPMDAQGRMQVTYGPNDTRDGVRVMQHWGFASSPPVGADVLVAHLGGSRNQGVVVGTLGSRDRPALQPGQAAMFNGAVTILADGNKVTITGATVLDLGPDGDVTAGGVSLRHHVHGGVQSGSAQTAPPVAT